MTPSSFTIEYLSGLKFKELQKLSAQFHVNRRWAKKQELIQNLLALNEKNKEEDEWKDGTVVFNDNQSNEVNRRLTFNISSKSNAEDPRLTFDVPQNGKLLLNEVSYSRETYDIPPKDFLADSRATYEVPPKGKLIDSQKSQEDLKTTFDLVIKNGKTKPEVKMLTIPCARVSRRVEQNSLKTESPIKISKRSINIKKSSRLPVNKSNLMKSPAFKSMSKQIISNSLVKTQPEKTIHSRVPVRLQFKEESNKENKKSLDANSTTIKKKPPNKSVKATPGTKPITSTKMPDFSKIHKKQFEQMDSLHDYIKKKEERIKKLFGTPQPGQGLCKTPVFHFQSAKSKTNETVKNMRTPLKKKDNSKTIQEAFMSKLPPTKIRTDIKDKNRSHIHGVRTNKRFELQMKFRNL